MADKGYIDSAINGLRDAVNLKRAFYHVVDTLRVGLPGHQKRGVNLQWYQLNSTTPVTASEEFSVVHGLDEAPGVIFPVVALTSSGGQLVPLTVARPADARRIYLRSTSTSAAFTVFVEKA